MLCLKRSAGYWTLNSTARKLPKIVTDIFGQELNKRVEQVSKEVSKKYESIIEKNSKNKESSKYSSFLGDAIVSDDEQVTLVLKEF
ncbi:MAG: hypothetical protein COV73_05060 [Candidatus Omnitrophica bacterium CG11_big_fil_rev_8_21_14_0_20_43_6]|nr:MAG: hypothetical protein COV73_05060 [Candidatus Omnitrophica bacterium CG11_big_fil_rev_8_21_14_0_20_43_6]